MKRTRLRIERLRVRVATNRENSRAAREWMIGSSAFALGDEQAAHRAQEEEYQRSQEPVIGRFQPKDAIEQGVCVDLRAEKEEKRSGGHGLRDRAREAEDDGEQELVDVEGAMQERRGGRDRGLDEGMESERRGGQEIFREAAEEYPRRVRRPGRSCSSARLSATRPISGVTPKTAIAPNQADWARAQATSRRTENSTLRSIVNLLCPRLAASSRRRTRAGRNRGRDRARHRSKSDNPAP